MLSQKRGMPADSDICNNGAVVPVGGEQKFLGMIFDSKLTFILLLKQLKHKCLKRMNIPKVLSHQSYGADQELLHWLYNASVGSRLKYGTVAYGSATKISLKILDPVLHLGLRLACGGFLY